MTESLFPDLSDSLLYLWMTGSKEIKLNFLSSHSILMSAESTTILENSANHPIFTSISEHILPLSCFWRPQNVHISPKSRYLFVYEQQSDHIDPENIKI